VSLFLLIVVNMWTSIKCVNVFVLFGPSVNANKLSMNMLLIVHAYACSAI